MIERILFPVGIALSGAGCTWCVVSGHVEIAICMGMVSLILIMRLIKAMGRTENRVKLLLEAVRNNDTTLRFSSPDTRVSRSLNEIAEILHEVRSAAIANETTYSLILSAISAGVMVVDSKGYVTKINPAALRLLGLEVITHIDRLADLNTELPTMLQTASAGSRLQVEFSFGFTPRSVVILVSEAVIGGEPLRLFVMDDIAGELESHEIESWSKLTRVLVHEIINSLAPVTSISRTLLSSPEIAEIPTNIRTGLDTIGSMSEGLTDFVNSFRALTSAPRVNPTLMELRPFLENMITAARSYAPDNAEIILSECDSSLIVFADAALTARVVTNILSNAVAAVAGEKHPEITVSAQCQPDDSVSIDIANNGPEIDASTAENIFIPFFTTRPEGQGIGLALCRQIMKAQGGSVALLPYGSSGLTVFRVSFF